MRKFRIPVESVTLGKDDYNNIIDTLESYEKELEKLRNLEGFSKKLVDRLQEAGIIISCSVDDILDNRKSIYMSVLGDGSSEPKVNIKSYEKDRRS